MTRLAHEHVKSISSLLSNFCPNNPKVYNANNMDTHHKKLIIQRSSKIFTSKLSLSTQLLLNSQQLIVLGQAFRPARRASLNLTSA
ncbi:hypothetical protein BpHYR1_045722 [Brachionus plicatilis]|uniref:Uncharacterized protein n=1 Tax=Brachionus plicatilis TaxID=10195 RepID=A0A3M7QX74_BRAPC|nr:hypothetical protein BpHYR1_045722 [Brachionus plicatilis]